MNLVSPNFPVILFMIFIFIIVAAIITGIVLIVVYSMKSARPRPPVNQNPNPYQHNYYGNYNNGHAHTNWNNTPTGFDNNSITHNPATWGAADAFNNQDMNNEMNTGGTQNSDKDHDGIPDQFDTHDNRFDHNMSNDSTSSFDTNTWNNDSASGGFDSGGSSGGSTDNNNF